MSIINGQNKSLSLLNQDFQVSEPFLTNKQLGKLPYFGNQKFNKRVPKPAGQGRNISFIPQCELWYAKWGSFNYLSTKKIEPSMIITPSMAIIVRDFHFKFSYDFTQPSFNALPGINSTQNAAVTNVSQLRGKITKYEEEGERKKSLFETDIKYGWFKGKGNWSYIEDLVSCNIVEENFDIKSNIFIVDLLPGEAADNKFISMLGLRFVHYNTRAFLRGEEIENPCNPGTTTADIGIPETKFNHLFLFLNMSRLLKFNSGKKKENKKVTFSLKGHYYHLLLGGGWAKNEPLRSVGTISYAGATSAIDGKVVFSIDADIAVNMNVKLSKKSYFDTLLGVRYTDWEILTNIKDGMQARSKEKFWGPYLSLAVKI